MLGRLSTALEELERLSTADELESLSTSDELERLSTALEELERLSTALKKFERSTLEELERLSTALMEKLERVGVSQSAEKTCDGTHLVHTLEARKTFHGFCLAIHPSRV